MKKIILVLAVLSLTAATASAQMFRFGVKGGISMLSTDVKSIINGNAIRVPEATVWSEFKSKDIGWNLGLMARIQLPLTNLYVQPELIYNHAGYKMLTTDGKSTNIKYGNIELPVLLGFKVLFLRANVGPTFTLAHIDDKDLFKVKRPDVGFQAGIGATIKNITLDVRYHGYFNKEWKNIDLNDIGSKLKANDGYWGISLGYFF